MYNREELYHYGVPGMKWGHRRQTAVDYARSNYRQAKRQYNKDYNTMYKAAGKTKSFAITKRGKAKKRRLWDDYSSKYDTAVRSAERVNAAKQQLKDAKAQQKATRQNAIRKRVKAYNVQGDKYERLANQAYDEKQKMDALYKKTGRSRLTRAINTARGKSSAVKAYNAQGNRYERIANQAYDEKQKMDALYRKTGRTRVTRVYNNIRYRR